MLITNNEIDLGKSFDRLVSIMNLAELRVKADPSPESYAQNYAMLRGGLQVHLKECTGEANIPAANINDINDINLFHGRSSSSS